MDRCRGYPSGSTTTGQDKQMVLSFGWSSNPNKHSLDRVHGSVLSSGGNAVPHRPRSERQRSAEHHLRLDGQRQRLVAASRVCWRTPNVLSATLASQIADISRWIVFHFEFPFISKFARIRYFKVDRRSKSLCNCEWYFVQKQQNLAFCDEEVMFFEHQLDLFGKLAYVSFHFCRNSSTHRMGLWWNCENSFSFQIQFKRCRTDLSSCSSK